LLFIMSIAALVIAKVMYLIQMWSD